MGNIGSYVMWTLPRSGGHIKSAVKGSGAGAAAGNSSRRLMERIADHWCERLFSSAIVSTAVPERGAKQVQCPDSA
jgi:hypothetical protein